MAPYLKIYDGTTDPGDHLTHHVTAVKGNDLTKKQVSSIMLKKFGETLNGGALTWYSQLPMRSIETFEEMADKFVTAHAGAKKSEARVNDIFAIKQSPREGLRDFLARFNHVRMTLPNVSKGMVVAAFQNGLNRNGSRATKKLLSRLMEYPLTTWDKIHITYCAEVHANEDDLNGPTQRLTSVQAESKKDRRNDTKRDLVAPRPNHERHQPYIRGAIMPPSRHEEGPSRPRTGTHRSTRGMTPLQSTHNFCVSPSEIVYALENLDPKVKWPQKMRSDPSTRKSNALYKFHQEGGHKIEDSIAINKRS
uniref:Uncharacterized protein LOC104221798 n=1 Tax=Nicotiana sylvestris TaxID=4096 RepID=A0A1U7VTM1_NICSY|nr:PREDICTED: uncharacterized protein LOC104221798 [Nicotiana sylvestris]